MADNFVTDPGSLGVTFASDDIGGVHYPITKFGFGALDSVTLASSGTGTDDAGTLRVTLATDIDLPTGPVTNAGTFAVQVDGAALTSLQLIDDVVKVLGTDTYTEAASKGNLIGAVRNDVLAALVDTDNEIAPFQVNNVGALWVDVPDALEDTNNSTTTPINANIDFTGTATDVTPYSGITVKIFADQDSDANGMRFEFSSDGTNWDVMVGNGFDYEASTGRTFQFDVQAQYFRVVFQNAGTNQGAFRMQTLLHHHPVSLTTIHRLDADLAPDRSATVTKSVIMGQAAGTGDFIPAQLTASGNFKTSIQEISDGLDIGAGNAGSETQRVSISTDDVNLAAINAGQLPDGHNVTVDNASGGSAVNIQDGGNSITVDGAVSATLDAETTKVIGTTIIGAAATGGMSYDQLALAAEDNDKIIKGSAGTLYFVSIQSIDATPVYLKLFDAASITPGTTSADFQFMCPANATAALGAGLVLNFGAQGIQMGTGIVALVATGAALDDNTPVSANEVFVTLGFE